MAVVQPLVRGVVIINADGRRVAARYCDKRRFRDLEAERSLEAALYRKMQTIPELPNAEDLFEMEDNVFVFKQMEDVFFFVVGDARENEIVLCEVLGALTGALELLLRKQVYDENMQLNLKLVLLTLDELVDTEGVILETDGIELASRVGASPYLSDSIPIGDQTLTQALQAARDQITRSILS